MRVGTLQLLESAKQASVALQLVRAGVADVSDALQALAQGEVTTACGAALAADAELPAAAAVHFRGRRVRLDHGARVFLAEKPARTACCIDDRRRGGTLRDLLLEAAAAAHNKAGAAEKRAKIPNFLYPVAPLLPSEDGLAVFTNDPALATALETEPVENVFYLRVGGTLPGDGFRALRADPAVAPWFLGADFVRAGFRTAWLRLRLAPRGAADLGAVVDPYGLRILVARRVALGSLRLADVAKAEALRCVDVPAAFRRLHAKILSETEAPPLASERLAMRIEKSAFANGEVSEDAISIFEQLRTRSRVVAPGGAAATADAKP